jgi:hypothetical protein
MFVTPMSDCRSWFTGLKHLPSSGIGHWVIPPCPLVSKESPTPPPPLPPSPHYGLAGTKLTGVLGGICSIGISASITALTIGAATVEPKAFSPFGSSTNAKTT